MVGGLLVTEGKKIWLDRAYNTSPTRTPINVVKIGDGTTSVTLADTDLGHAVPIAGTNQVDDCEALTGWSSSTDLTLSLNTTVVKEGTNSINLTKTSGTEAFVTTAKTTSPQLDFTSKTLSLWLYIIDAPALAKLTATTAVIIRYGSDSSNYYQWDLDASAFTAGGFNLIDNLTSSNATSTTGTPVLTAMDYAYIILNTNNTTDTWTAGDFAMDDWKLADASSYTKTFESGYPVLDFTALTSTIRTRVTTVQANGYNISEIGFFNSDSPTRTMESRSTFTPVSKTDTDELIFIMKVKVN